MSLGCCQQLVRIGAQHRTSVSPFRRPFPMMQSPPADQHEQHELEEHDRGLVYDLDTLDRRRVLKLLGFGGLSAGLFTLIGCGPSWSDGQRECRGRGDGRHGSELCARAGRDRGSVPGRRVERPEHPGRERCRAQRHPLELRVVDDCCRGRPACDPADGPGRRMRSAGGRGGLPLALRPGRQLLDVLGGGSRRELPAWRPGGRRHGPRHVQQRLPGLLPGPLAAHPLRGVPEPRAGDGRAEQDRHLPDRAAAGRLRNGVRDRRLRAERADARPGVTRERHGLQRRRRSAPARHGDRQRGGRLYGRAHGVPSRADLRDRGLGYRVR